MRKTGLNESFCSEVPQAGKPKTASSPQMKTALAAVGYIVIMAINLSVPYMNSSFKMNLWLHRLKKNPQET